MQSSCSSLAGKCALITGASRGIGRGIALRLAERGAAVAVNYHQNESAAQAVVSEIQAAGGKAIALQADVSDPDQLTGLIQSAHKCLGALDIFVSNALGDLLGFMASPLSVSLSQWDAAHQCQSRAFLVGVQQAASLLREGGRIIAISYWPGSHLGGFAPYFAMGAQKSTLESMCRYFAVSLAPRRITVNTVCAGLTDDSVLNHLPHATQQAMLVWLRSGWNPTGRPGTPADIGGAVSTLCSDDAAWITGQTIVADGGASLMSPEVPLLFQQS